MTHGGHGRGPRPLLILSAGNVPARYGLNEGFAGMFLRLGGIDPSHCLVLDVTRRVPPRDPLAYSGLIVTGSLSMVTDRPRWSVRLGDFMLKALESGAPLLGVCYGHQLLAHALGGEVGYHPLGMEQGTHRIRLSPGAMGHPFLAGLPESFPANLSHSQSVLSPPKGAQVLGSSGHDPHQLLGYGDKCLTVQFHPEFDRGVMEAFVGPLPKKRPKGGPAPNLGLPLKDTPESASVLQNFVALHGERARKHSQEGPGAALAKGP
ncbi:MAG: glutamine amidotransferase [Deltaproteobacteria bacterium]|jgi:GMP synthase (glutamine-hydrolysing)|nr:glutamine amidotransferase [Deltaproteobacteria bacterium]